MDAFLDRAHGEIQRGKEVSADGVVHAMKDEVPLLELFREDAGVLVVHSARSDELRCAPVPDLPFEVGLGNGADGHARQVDAVVRGVAHVQPVADLRDAWILAARVRVGDLLALEVCARDVYRLGQAFVDGDAVHAGRIADGRSVVVRERTIQDMRLSSEDNGSRIEGRLCFPSMLGYRKQYRRRCASLEMPLVLFERGNTAEEVA